MVLGSVIWWPGLKDALEFHFLSDWHIADTHSKIGSWLDSANLGLIGIEHKVTQGFNALLGGEYLPEAQVDARHDAPVQTFSERLWSSPYFVSMRAMLELSCVRGILALAWFAVLSPLMLAVAIDAWVVRRLKYESFAVHHPTLYKVALSSPSVLLGCAFMVMLMPWFIPAWVACGFYLAFLMSLHLIVSNFHRFG